MFKQFCVFGVILLAGTSCMLGEKEFNKKLRTALKEDPTILNEAIEAHPVEFFEMLSKASQSARQETQKRQAQRAIDEGIKNPKVPNIRPDEAVRGTQGAPLVLVEYSDFECSFCSRGFQTVQELLKKYEGKIQFVYKHLPLDFHKNAMNASLYYEAARLQDKEKAFQLHDKIFARQRELKGGEKFLKAVAKEVGLNMGRLKKDIKSAALKTRIQDDMREAARFGFRGTPGFLLNGIPIRGAMGIAHFDNIITKLKESGKLKL